MLAEHIQSPIFNHQYCTQKKNSFNGDVDYPLITLTTYNALEPEDRTADLFTLERKLVSRLRQEADYVRATL